MSEIEIPAEHIQAWHNEQRLVDQAYSIPRIGLMNALEWALAGWMRSEFQREHRLDGRRDLVWCMQCSYGDVHKAAAPDPRHAWATVEQWMPAARKVLEEKR